MLYALKCRMLVEDHKMKLGKLLESIDLSVAPNVAIRPVNNLQIDSRLIEPGDIFIAIAGISTKGYLFINQAIAQGAIAIMVDAEIVDTLIYPFSIPLISVIDLANKVGILADYFYGKPSTKMPIVGVTGTNGKTSTTQFIAQICDANGLDSGIMGTLGYGFFGSLVSATHTTSDCITNHKILAQLHRLKAKTVSMEVSSHALTQRRLDGIRFYIAIFTNLTQDHLDYHLNMQNYFEAKTKLFLELDPEYSIINIDDPYGLELLNSLFTTNKKVIAISKQKEALDFAENFPVVVLTGNKVISPWGEYEFIHPLIGGFNDYNLLSAFTAACLLEIPAENILKSIRNINPIPGRLEVIKINGMAPKVIVDFAHTPDALERALETVKSTMLEGKKLWCVFGCGGERDASKRHLMLLAALAYADQIIITQDNSRSEVFEDILYDILQGATSDKIIIEADREKAIAIAVGNADNSDIILIAGKGHEQYQLIGGEKIKFSDQKVALNYLKERLSYERS